MAALTLNCMPYSMFYDIIRTVPTQGIYEERRRSLFEAIGPLKGAPCWGGGLVGVGQNCRQNSLFSKHDIWPLGVLY